MHQPQYAVSPCIESTWTTSNPNKTHMCAVPVHRFLYLPVLSGAEGAKEDDFTFKAYPLTDDKDFTNFFHPDKDAILQLVSTA